MGLAGIRVTCCRWNKFSGSRLSDHSPCRDCGPAATRVHHRYRSAILRNERAEVPARELLRNPDRAIGSGVVSVATSGRVGGAVVGKEAGPLLHPSQSRSIAEKTCRARSVDYRAAPGSIERPVGYANTRIVRI